MSTQASGDTDIADRPSDNSWTGELGPIRSTLWGIKHVLTSVRLLAVVVAIELLAGAVTVGVVLFVPASTWAAVLGTFALRLFLHAYTMRHAGVTLGYVPSSERLARGAALAVPKLAVAWIVMLGGFVAISALNASIPASPISLVLMVFMVVFVVHTLLSLPAVCIDTGLGEGLRVAWRVARGERMALLGMSVIGLGIWLAAGAAIVWYINDADPLLFPVPYAGLLVTVAFSAGLARLYVGLT